jgi:hypothetical protein
MTKADRYWLLKVTIRVEVGELEIDDLDTVELRPCLSLIKQALSTSFMSPCTQPVRRPERARDQNAKNSLRIPLKWDGDHLTFGEVTSTSPDLPRQ